MTVSNDSVKTNLVEVRGLELEHLVDTSAVDGVGCFGNLLGRSVGTTETGRDELLAVLVEQVEGVKVSTGRDLNQLRETVTDLSLRETAEEREIEEGADRSMVSTETVLVVAVVDGNLDGNGSINQTNHSSGDSDEVGVAAVRRTGESTELLVLFSEWRVSTA